MIGKYMLEAMEKFLEDHNIEYGGISSDDRNVNFEWISSNISYVEMDLFQKEFDLILQSFGLSDDSAKLEDVDFWRGRDGL